MDKGLNLKEVAQLTSPILEIAQEISQILIDSGYHVTKPDFRGWGGTRTPIKIFIEDEVEDQ